VYCVSGTTTTQIKANKVVNPATAVVTRDNGFSAINGEGLIDWTPTVVSGSGTITSYTVNEAAYYELEKMTYFTVDVTITDNGTGATNILISLPFTASAYPASVCGRETATAGFMISGMISASATNLNVAKVDGTYPGGTNNRLVLSGWYERV
jgi:hypothetical protein